jgi:Carboxypeptidase regulatory-like domain
MPMRPQYSPFRRNRRRRCFTRATLLLLAIYGIGVVLCSRAPAQTSNTETFPLSGTVVNSMTGEPIARALVRANGVVQRSVFSDGEGRFEIDGLQRAQVIVSVQKPGYVSASGAPSASVQVGSNSTGLVLKLSPQSAIYGRIVDASGQPLEHVPVRLTARSLRDGRRVWEQRGMTDSDEDGRFRFPNLMPGTYYASAGPLEGQTDLLAMSHILAAGEKPKSGFPHVYYPGVAELASAVPIQLTPGQQVEADFSFSAVPVYQVSGAIAGHLPEQGVGLEVFTASGDNISVPINFNMETGAFKIDGIPAGSYIVRAISQDGLQPTRGEARINVAANLEDVRVVLAPAVSIAVNARMESRLASRGNAEAGNARGWGPISVRLLPADPNTAEVFSTVEQRDGRPVMTLRNVDPGTYTVELMPQPPWYVQSATYGQTNVMLDDISVSIGQSYPMDIVLRDDSASLTATVKSSDAGGAPPATVIVVPQAGGKIAPRVVRASGSFSVYALAPGDYLVFAFDSIDDLEYGNPEAYGLYASQAAHVTLTPNQKAQVSLDLIHVGKGQQ